jgi:hypothetical protein
MHLVPRSSSCLRPWLDQLSPSYAPEYHFCNIHLTCDVHHVSIIQFLDHHICSLVLNPVRFTLSTCSTLSTLVSPLIELSSKHQNSQESFHKATLCPRFFLFLLLTFYSLLSTRPAKVAFFVFHYQTIVARISLSYNMLMILFS